MNPLQPYWQIQEIILPNKISPPWVSTASRSSWRQGSFQLQMVKDLRSLQTQKQSRCLTFFHRMNGLDHSSQGQMRQQNRVENEVQKALYKGYNVCIWEKSVGNEENWKSPGKVRMREKLTLYNTVVWAPKLAPTSSGPIPLLEMYSYFINAHALLCCFPNVSIQFFVLGHEKRKLLWRCPWNADSHRYNWGDH